jgi:hypothetical protein
MAGQVCGISQDIVPLGATDRGSAADSMKFRGPGDRTRPGRRSNRGTVMLFQNCHLRWSALPGHHSSLIPIGVMRRILVLIWLSLSLAIASGPAFALPSPDCPKAQSSAMADGHEGMAGDHDRMDCCADNCSRDCATVCPGTVMPPAVAGVEPAGPAIEQRAAWLSTMLRSAVLATSDPPPRTTVG